MAIDINSIIQRFESAQAKANQANEKRYQQILASFTNLGRAGRTRIARQTAAQQATAGQSLISRGLGGTTIKGVVRRGIASDAEFQRQQLEESVALQRAGVMERRTDLGPDLGMFSSLLMAAGQAGAGQPAAATAGGGGQVPTIRTLGPMASQGRDIFGRPFQGSGGGSVGGPGSTPPAGESQRIFGGGGGGVQSTGGGGSLMDLFAGGGTMITPGGQGGTEFGAGGLAGAQASATSGSAAAQADTALRERWRRATGGERQGSAGMSFSAWRRRFNL